MNSEIRPGRRIIIPSQRHHHLLTISDISLRKQNRQRGSKLDWTLHLILRDSPQRPCLPPLAPPNPHSPRPHHRHLNPPLAPLSNTLGATTTNHLARTTARPRLDNTRTHRHRYNYQDRSNKRRLRETSRVNNAVTISAQGPVARILLPWWGGRPTC